MHAERTVGGFYLLHHYPWLFLALVVVVVGVLYLQRRK